MSFTKIIKKLFKKKKIICPRCRGSDISKDDSNYTSSEALYSYKCNKCRIHFVPNALYLSKYGGYSSYRQDYLKKMKKKKRN